MSIKEHGVAENIASRIVLYFNEGARDAGLIGPGGVIAMPDNGTSAQPTKDAPAASERDDPQDDEDADVSTPFIRGYTVRITGPGIDTRIAIKDEENIEIVDVTLRKVRRLLKAQQKETGGTTS